MHWPRWLYWLNMLACSKLRQLFKKNYSFIADLDVCFHRHFPQLCQIYQNNTYPSVHSTTSTLWYHLVCIYVSGSIAMLDLLFDLPKLCYIGYISLYTYFYITIYIYITIHIDIFIIHYMYIQIYTQLYYSIYITWLVVSTPLKNISQLGCLFPIYGKIINVPNHQTVYI